MKAEVRDQYGDADKASFGTVGLAIGVDSVEVDDVLEVTFLDGSEQTGKVLKAYRHTFIPQPSCTVDVKWA